MDTFLEALPDQSLLASQKLSGMDLVNRPPLPPQRYQSTVTNRTGRYISNRPLFGPTFSEAILTELFLDATFLETFFTKFPWRLPLPQSHEFTNSIFNTLIPLVNPPASGDITICRQLSLRNLPQNNSRWSDEAKFAFSQFFDKVVETVRALHNYLVSSYLI